MTYGIVMDVPAPIEFYDAMHAEIVRRTRDGADGLLLHVCRQAPGGFQITEVWESKELSDRFIAEIVGPVVEQLSGGQPPPQEPAILEFEPRGLVVPGAHVTV